MTVQDLILEIYNVGQHFAQGTLTLDEALTVAIDILAFVRDARQPLVFGADGPSGATEADLDKLLATAEEAKGRQRDAAIAGDVAATSVPWDLIMAILPILIEWLRNRRTNP